MRKQRRKDVNLGMIFANVTNRTTKTMRLTDLYKKLGLNFHGSWDYIWTISPDGKTESFTAVPYKPTFDDEKVEYIPYDGRRVDFTSNEEYLKEVIGNWRNGG